MRTGLGILFILKGYPTVFGGPEAWESYGEMMQYVGIEFAPMFFGFIIAIIEFFGGIFLILGLFFTPTLISLILVMIVLVVKEILIGGGFALLSNPIMLAIIFFSLLFIGPGQQSLDNYLKSRRRLY